ncbi:glycosyltransferase family 2 protein [Psychroserpens sp. NJDZ02]|uniref:glycosyltransferase family 2 protein n=1 Tax=Psychroserpens sp. NJDZ02 TaxID=2570561 RepID=UPI0010A76ACB|nr:glycosyltransferase family 2 protein [Psychroserpens sp. NJDZ02]QCE40281.1 glycosyltransferase family 2 protein [Psychroserpens sp. NJDZ02]
MRDISVIIINYNTSKYTVKCISSVIEHTNPMISFEIIVVDNNSNIDDYNYLKNNLPNSTNITLHRSNVNTGFGGGNMFGAQFANANYLLFLNNDAFLMNDCLSIISNYMDAHPEVGVSTAQNYDKDNNHIISFGHNKGIRRLLLGRSFLEKKDPKQFPRRKKKYKNPVSVNFINGAFMFFRSEVFSKVGGFDTNIFLYFEEMDICYRIKKNNYSSVLVPEAKITHCQGASTGVSKTISKEGFISYLYVIKKNYSYFKYTFIRLYYCLTFITKPKKWFLLSLAFTGAPLSKSLKQKQTINFIDNEGSN